MVFPLFFIDGILLAGILTFLVCLIRGHSRFMKQVKTWKRHDERFLATLQNMEMITRSNLSTQEKRDAMVYLYNQYHQDESH